VTNPEQGAPIAAEQERTAQVLRDIGRFASLGRLEVFGYETKPGLNTAENPTRIPAEFWVKGGRIGYNEFLQNTGGRATRRAEGEREETYVNLGFDSRQAHRLFPRRWRWPKIVMSD
jgi:hypothetical protein